MQDKQVHIVFQVTRFIFSENSLSYKLTEIEKLILINLATHQGNRGIYPSISTLSKELKLTKWPIMRAIKTLSEKKLITVEKNLGKSNNYKLTIYCSTSGANATSELSTAGSSSATSETTTSSWPATTLVAGQHPTSSWPATLSNIDKQHRRNNRENTRPPKARSPLSSFEPNNANQILIAELKLNLQEEIESFRNRFKGEMQNLQYEFERWLKNSYNFKQKNKSNGHSKPQEIRSTVQWFFEKDKPCIRN